MTHFVSAYGNSTLGFPMINLDLVQLLKPGQKDGKLQTFECYGADQEFIGIISSYDVPRTKCHFIPNTTQVRFLGMWLKEDGSVGMEEMPIVGWKILDDISEPILPGASHEGYKLWALTDGSACWIPEEYSCDTQAELLGYARESLHESLEQQKKREAELAAKKTVLP